MIDIYARSQELLETIANSIYDRDPQLDKPFFLICGFIFSFYSETAIGGVRYFDNLLMN